MKSGKDNRTRLDVKSYLETYKWAKVNDPGQLAMARTFLGSSPHMLVNLGTELILQYHKAIGYSGADEESHWVINPGPVVTGFWDFQVGIFRCHCDYTYEMGKDPSS